jgi:hypothetical protein
LIPCVAFTAKPCDCPVVGPLGWPSQAILLPSDLETTLNVYTHAIPESQRRAVGKVAEILFPNVPEFAETAQSAKAN